MDSYGNSGFKGISIRRADVSSLFSNNIRAKKLSITDSAILNDVTITNSLSVTGEEPLITSKDTIISEGFVIGGNVVKDMNNEDYRQEFDPAGYTSIFPDLPQIIDANIVAGDKSEANRLIASFWDDLGNDVFDDWGYFYIFDVESGKYYFPLINPQNQSNGVFNTQTFNAFGRTFTIKHGWCVQGIFKFDISVNDDKPFRFGAYGNMGSDGDEDTEQLSQSYTLDGNSLTLYYHHHAESGDSNEVLFSYFIPKVISENELQTYQVYYDEDDMNIRSVEVTKGLIVYFSKRNDVKNWVINDLKLLTDGDVDISGKLYVNGNILSKGYNIDSLSVITMNNSDYTAIASSLINGYFKSNTLTANRNFTIPSAKSIVLAIPNCAVNTCIRFTINNIQDGGYNRNIQTADGSVTLTNVNPTLFQYMVLTYIIVITNITSGSESAIVLQESNFYILP